MYKILTSPITIYLPTNENNHFVWNVSAKTGAKVCFEQKTLSNKRLFRTKVHEKGVFVAVIMDISDANVHLTRNVFFQTPEVILMTDCFN
jgi:hypothetical protein